MKKFLLATLFAAASMTVMADDIVYFYEDFEWLEPWSTAGDNNGKPAGDSVGKDNMDEYCPQLATSKVDGVTTYKALTNKGYKFEVKNHESVTARTADKATYLQTNYLKFGLTGIWTCMTLPAFEKFPQGDEKPYISFVWATQRQSAPGLGIDPTKLVVVVKNGDNEKQFVVPPHGLQTGAKIEWIPVNIELKDVTIDENTRITIRNNDNQWPCPTKAALRYYLDNIKVYAADPAGINEVEVDEEDAPAEYYNLQGVRVENPANGLYIKRQGNKATKVVL